MRKLLLIVLSALFLAACGDSEETAKETKQALEDYKEVKTTVTDGFTSVEIAKDKNMAKFDYWLMGFSKNAVSVLEEEFKNEKTQKVRIYEKSIFLDENGKESEDVLFDVTITREAAEQLEYDNFKSLVSTEPYRLFNKGEQYYIHVGMFMKEISPELRSGFESSFEKK